MPKFGEGREERSSSLSTIKQCASLSFGSGSGDTSESFNENMNRRAGRESRIGEVGGITKRKTVSQ